MGKVKVFLDSDVIISSLLSKTGASFEILKNAKVKKVISKTIKEEVLSVAKRLSIDLAGERIYKNIKIVPIKLKKARLAEEYLSYVLDQEDSHVVAGANIAKANFLLTHNLKHYQVTKIKNDFEIIVMKPGNFLQYLRSLKI